MGALARVAAKWVAAQHLDSKMKRTTSASQIKARLGGRGPEVDRSATRVDANLQQHQDGLK